MDQDGTSSTFGFESSSSNESWLLGINIPIFGQQLIEINEKTTIENIAGLSRVFGVNQRIEPELMSEIIKLLSKFHTNARLNSLLARVVESENFKLRISALTSMGVILRSYSVDFVHKGVVFDSHLFRLSFLFEHCYASLR